MNKVVTINLGGCAYQLEEGGYDALQAYLETATAQLQGNPDRDEILSDIERAIAEKFNTILSSHKTVVETKEVAAILEAMGPVDAESDEDSEPANGRTGAAGGSGKQEKQEAGSARAPRRLYRIPEGSMIAGVCNGIGAYFNVDPTLVRIAFVILALIWGAGLIVYIVMAFVIPEAKSPEEKAAASGFPSTAQEFIRRAQAGYYEAMKGFPNGKTQWEWNRWFKPNMRTHSDQWRYNRHGYWAQHAPNHPGMGLTLVVLSLLVGAASILFLSAVVSLLATGSVFGVMAPSGAPVWVTVLLLLVSYGILMAPLKFAQRSYYYSVYRLKTAGPFTFYLDIAIKIAVTLTLLWLAVQYFPELSEAIRNIPVIAHQAADDIHEWRQ